MRIGINAHINPSIQGGVETNIVSLVRSLAERNCDTAAVLCLPSYVEEFSELSDGKIPVFKWKIKTASERQRVSFRAPVARGKFLRNVLGESLFGVLVQVYRDIRYAPGTAAPISAIDKQLARIGVGALHFPTPDYFESSYPFIYEPWDLQYLHYPDFFSCDEFEARGSRYKRGCEKAAIIIVATEWTKNDIVKQFDVDPCKIVVIRRSSLNSKKVSEADRIRLLQPLLLPNRFVFYPAMTFPHKNHLKLLEALVNIKTEKNISIPLVMTGRRHDAAHAPVRSYIERHALQDQIFDLGPVSPEILSALYQTAAFLVFPSLFEGLGLPLLEAMEHKLPIAAAKQTCIPEVVGKAARLFDGNSVQDIGECVYRAWHEPNWINATTTHAREQLDIFNWGAATTKFLKCYDIVLGKRSLETAHEA